jgi:hypothetical protein
VDGLCRPPEDRQYFHSAVVLDERDWLVSVVSAASTLRLRSERASRAQHPTIGGAVA